MASLVSVAVPEDTGDSAFEFAEPFSPGTFFPGFIELGEFFSIGVSPKIGQLDEGVREIRIFG